MKITLNNAGKKYNREWIFRGVNFSFTTGNAYSITGPNGSGKSTLLQLIAGSLNPNEGEIIFFTNEEKKIDNERWNTFVSIAAPYLELIEEMTAKELLNFHNIFKPLIPNKSVEAILQEVQLLTASNKQIRFFSSGMKQRLKLAQAIFSDTPVLLLDEPCTNLDSEGYSLYNHLIKNYCSDKIIIVSSNDKNEYQFCNENIDILSFKKI